MVHHYMRVHAHPHRASKVEGICASLTSKVSMSFAEEALCEVLNNLFSCKAAICSVSLVEAKQRLPLSQPLPEYPGAVVHLRKRYCGPAPSEGKQPHSEKGNSPIFRLWISSPGSCLN